MHFIKRGQYVFTASEDDIQIENHLEPGVYNLEYGREFFLSLGKPFELPPKLYGNTVVQGQRVLNTFNQRSTSTGVMFAGEKGSGKTLLSKYIAMEAINLGIPVILVNNEYSGDEFSKFVQNFEQPVVFFFDEFEKIYSDEAQEQLLTLLDGCFASNKLFMFTCNLLYKINSCLKNRPSRIYYLIEFSGLSNEFIEEYCMDALEDKSFIHNILTVAQTFSDFNFDMLKSIVEEHNRYKSSISDIITYLNVKPESEGHDRFIVTLNVGKELDEDDDDYKQWSGKPLTTDTIRFSLGFNSEKDCYEYAMFTRDDLVDIDVKNGVFIYKNDKDQHLTLKRIRTSDSYMHLFDRAF